MAARPKVRILPFCLLCSSFLSGIGLYLQQLAQELPHKYDLHEPDRLLASLGPYDHLGRLFRLCVVHGFRNIKSCAVSEEVRDLMRSLLCMRHPCWDETIASIQTLGGKAGRGVFFFPA